MPTDKTPRTITPLAGERSLLLKELEALELKLKANADAMIALGAGKYADAEGNGFTVVAAVAAGAGKTSFVLESANVDRAKELAGEKFRTLFKRVESFEPIDAFNVVVPTHLTPAKARDLVALCTFTKPGGSAKAAYVKAG